MPSFVTAVPQEVVVPVIDISGFLTGDDTAKADVIQRFRQACENQGFLQITGHSVPIPLMQSYLSQVSEFFSQSLGEKNKVLFSRSASDRGYEQIGIQKLDMLDENASPDQKEAFSVRVDREPDRFLQGRNQWPEKPAKFRPVTEEYFSAVHELSRKLFRLMALSLDLKEDYFDGFSADPDGLCLLRCHHYPPTNHDETGRTRGIGAHTDFGAMTLLLQDEVGGLEVLHHDTNTWHLVKPVPGAFVVNIGDIMQRWTNNRYRSTMHRVISPLAGRDRYSAAFFNEGCLDQVIECIPTCLKPGEKPLFPPVRMEEHLLKRYKGSYGDDLI